jgi:hypothetical protein
VEKWYSCYLAYFKTIFMKSKEILNILTRKHDHDRVSKWFENSKKIQIKFKNYENCTYLMISYVKAVVKNANEFWIFCHVRWLEIEKSPMKFHRVTKDMVRFVSDATFKLHFDFKTCLYKQYDIITYFLLIFYFYFIFLWIL